MNIVGFGSNVGFCWVLEVSGFSSILSCLLYWLDKIFFFNELKKILGKKLGTFLSECFLFKIQVHFFSNNDVLSKYWLYISLYYCFCFACPAVSATAQWNGSVGWSARKIQPLLPQLLSYYFITGLVLQFDHGVVQWAAVLVSLWWKWGDWECVCGKDYACFFGMAV